jgi:hypothetical protein
MGAVILAVIGAIGQVLSAINGVYSFVKNADEFLNGRSDWDQVRAVISSQISIRNQVLQVSGQILDAVANLDRRIFLENVADKLGDSDQAVLALDTWKRTGDLDQRAIALNESAGALADPTSPWPSRWSRSSSSGWWCSRRPTRSSPFRPSPVSQSRTACGSFGPPPTA